MANNATRHNVTSMVGSNIKRARDEKGFSQHELALRIGARADQVSKWEAGRHRPDTYMAAICKALGRDLSYFYTEHSKNGKRP